MRGAIGLSVLLIAGCSSLSEPPVEARPEYVRARAESDAAEAEWIQAQQQRLRAAQAVADSAALGYGTCALDYVKRFGPTRATATELAQAAVTSCGAREREYAEALRLEVRLRAELNQRQSGIAYASTVAAFDVDKMLASTRDIVFQRALQAAVEAQRP